MATQASRYIVQRSHDSMGGIYATGPLTFLETDDFGTAQQEVIARGGVIIDTLERKTYTQYGPEPWIDLDEADARRRFRTASDPSRP